MDCNVFDRVVIQAWVPGGALIQWYLKSTFRFKGDAHFYVDWARPGDPNWQPISHAPVINHCMTIDGMRRMFGVDLDIYYRVRLVTPDDSDQIYTSQPHNIYGSMNKRDWLYSREIVRQKYLSLNKGDGSTGWLLKRRRWGTRCSRCADYDTGEGVNYNCTICFGTGYVYGYFPGIPFPIKIEDSPSRKVTHDTAGPVKHQIVSGTGITYPVPDTEDVWVSNDPGDRYFLQTIDHMVHVRGVPLIVKMEMRLAPFTHIIYTVPLVGAEPSSSEEEDATPTPTPTPVEGVPYVNPREWRRGLTGDSW